MHTLIALGFGASLALAFTATAATAATPTETLLMKREQAWADAVLKKDYKALSGIIAADWAGQDDSADKMTRAKLIAGLKSGDVIYTSEEIGPMTVRVMGNTAVVQGSDSEKSSIKGKDTSGKYTWTDVFELRNGQWVAVNSQNTKAK